MRFPKNIHFLIAALILGVGFASLDGYAQTAATSKTAQAKVEPKGYRKIEKSEVIWIDIDDEDFDNDRRGSYEVRELRKKVAKLERATRQLQDHIVLLEEKLEETLKEKEPESHRCILASSYKNFYEAMGKTEKEARMQVYLKCRSVEQLGSACVEKRIKCAL